MEGTHVPINFKMLWLPQRLGFLILCLLQGSGQWSLTRNLICPVGFISCGSYVHLSPPPQPDSCPAPWQFFISSSLLHPSLSKSKVPTSSPFAPASLLTDQKPTGDKIPPHGNFYTQLLWVSTAFRGQELCLAYSDMVSGNSKHGVGTQRPSPTSP